MRRSSSGISPVVATVILVAIAIVIAIAVAFWASGLVGIFTRFEKIEIRSAYATATDDSYDVHLLTFNSGSSSATIDELYINGQPAKGLVSECKPEEVCDGKPETGVTLKVGASQEIIITIDKTTFSPGVTIEVMVHTASGKQYPTAVLLP